MARFPRLRREEAINATTPAEGDSAVPEEEEAAPAEEAPEGAADAKDTADAPEADPAPEGSATPEPEADPAPEGSATPEPEAETAPAAKKLSRRQRRRAEKRQRPELEERSGPEADRPGEGAVPGPGESRGLPHRAKAAAAVLGAAAILGGGLAALGVFDSDDGGTTPGSTPAPVVTQPAESSNPGSQAAADLGFPAFATSNTTRVGGSDSAANAAAVALATYPSTGGSRSPLAFSLVGESDWQSGIAASSLVAAPLSIPVLISTGDGVPDATAQALTALAPRGGALSGGTQVFTIGDAAAPDNLRERPLIGADPASLAAAIDRLKTELTGSKPAHIVITSSEAAEYAMPAAGWAARSGDPVLFTGPKKLPAATAKALKSHHGVPVYVLGPPPVISETVMHEISAAAGAPARRISGADPVANAISFASFRDGDFGWNIKDPGHGFVVARSDHPLDAAAAARLSASGTWGPLLLTDSTDTLPGALRGYLRAVQPGYREDPTRALYNHVWVIGDEEAISVEQQAAIDDLAELTQINPPPLPVQAGATGAGGPKGAGKPTGAKGAGGPTGAKGATAATGASGAKGATGGAGAKSPSPSATNGGNP